MTTGEIEAVRIVAIAVDRSKQAEQAFDYYADRLHRKENKVILIHVPEGVTVEMSKGMRMNEGEWQKMKEREEQEMKEIRTKYEKKLSDHGMAGSSLHVAYGRPGEALVKALETFKADMVVIGTRGLGSIRRTLMGSVSDYVVHHAHCPVIVCRQ